ncbi:MAG: acetylxylan esterase [Verrucomicrobia bacterium]|nr:acetylxylan esterase [Verrucomicrobiota bacterium]
MTKLASGRRGSVALFRLGLAAWCGEWSLVCSLSAAAPSSAGGYTLRVSTDRAEANYRRGERVTFSVVLTRDATGERLVGPAAKWSITKDGKPLERSGVTALPAGGELTLTGTLEEPGFLHCLVECTPAEGAPKLTARAGAAIEPQSIAPSLPAPADFDAFWAEQKRRLAAVEPRLRLTPVPSPADGILCFDVQAETGLGRGLSGYLVRPVNAKAGSLPAIVLCHGAGVTTARLSIAVAWAKDGFVALDFNAHGLPNGRPREFYAALQAGELKEYYLQGRGSRETMYLRGVFLRLLRAIETVTAEPAWDGRRLVALGRSQGGGQALAAGALDSRVNYVSAEIPTFCDHTGIVAGRINGWPRIIPNDTAQPDPKMVEAVRYYDAVNFAPRIRARVFVTVGYIDHICPPTGVYAMFNQLRGERKIWEHLDTGHVSRPDYEARVREEVLAWAGAAKSAAGR